MKRQVLCVCFGNTCRSPMMAAILGLEFEIRGISVFVESAGISEKLIRETEHAAPEAVAQMHQWGRDISGHRARHITSYNLRSYDMIIVVDDKIKQAVIAAGAKPETVVILNEKNGGVPNPWQRGMAAYHACAVLMRDELADIAEKWKV